MITYEGAATAWAGGPMRVYARLAEVLVGDAPFALDGVDVLDLGTGTGAVAVVAGSAGARVIAADLSHDMLEHDRVNRPPAAQADAVALPFAASTFDAVFGGFLFNHFDDPVPALRESARVLRPGGVVAGSFFAAGADEVKDAVDRVVRSHGWTAPDWYLAIRATQQTTGSADALIAAGRAAGLVDVAAIEHDVRMAMSAEDAAAYRLGMLHTAPWVETLDAGERATVTNEVIDAIAPLIDAWTMGILVLAGRQPR